MEAPVTTDPSELLVIIPDKAPAVIAENGTPLLLWLLTVTVTGPLVTLAGTVAVIAPSFQVGVLAGNPLKRTMLAPWVVPKFKPLIVMESPGAPELELRVAILGGGITVSGAPLLES